MRQLKFQENFARLRKRFALTQGDVAAYAGVTSAAVSKWEQGLSYPDLSLLPKLAALFDVTIDELLGYEPQLSHAKITEMYRDFSERFGRERFETVRVEIEDMLKEYYSCYPFLVRISQLYLNYYFHAEHPQNVLNRVIELCERTVANSGDFRLNQEARVIHATALLIMGRPQELLDEIGYEVPIQFGMEKLIAKAYAMLGNLPKAQETLQINAFQHLCEMISSEIEFLALASDDPNLFDERVRRIENVIGIYHMERLHPYLKIMFYYQSASGYMRQQRQEAALQMLEGFYETCKNVSFPLKIGGDGYFSAVDQWIHQHIYSGPYAPRHAQAIKNDLLNMLEKEPRWIPLHESPRFKTIVRNLQRMFQSNGE